MRKEKTVCSVQRSETSCRYRQEKRCLVQPFSAMLTGNIFDPKKLKKDRKDYRN